MRYLIFIVFIVVIILSTGCVSDNQKTIVDPTLTLRPSEPIIIPSTTQMNQDGIVKNGIIIYRSPEKIIKPEDLQIGDLIQMSLDDPRYDKDHGFLVENISRQNNQYLIKQIVNFKSENRWFGINTTNSVVITSGALIRDYPYKFGHASEPLPQKCLTCGYGYSVDENWCSSDALIFFNCDDPRYNRTSTIINPP